MRRLLAALLCCAACTAQSDRSATGNHGRTPDSEDTFPFGRPGATADIAEPRISILGVTIGMADDAVQRELGPPMTASDPETVDGHSVFAWHYPGIEVSFDEHRVHNLQCATQRCVTAEGIRTGSTHADVLRTYGPGFRGYSRSNEVLAYYSRPRNCRMVFTFSDGRVERMYFQCDFPLPAPLN